MDVRTLMSWVTFPVLLFGAIGIAALLRAHGVPADGVVFLVTLGAAFPVLVLQELMPYEPRWRGTFVDWTVDLLHFLLSTLLVTTLLRVALYDGAAWLAEAHRTALGWSVWPDRAPLLLQLAIAVLVGDFCSYWMHRAFHDVPWMWRIHAVHHSAERMYVLASVRNHPLNTAFTYGAQTVPLVVLGADANVLMMYTIVTAVIGILQHSNVNLHTGWLNRVISTPELHRWHHETDSEALNCNFGADTAVWDQVFGTRYLPSDKEPRNVGIVGSRIPVNWLSHLGLPLRLEQWIRDAVTPAPAPVRVAVESDRVSRADR